MVNGQIKNAWMHEYANEFIDGWVIKCMEVWMGGWDG